MNRRQLGADPIRDEGLRLIAERWSEYRGVTLSPRDVEKMLEIAREAMACPG